MFEEWVVDPATSAHVNDRHPWAHVQVLGGPFEKADRVLAVPAVRFLADPQTLRVGVLLVKPLRARVAIHGLRLVLLDPAHRTELGRKRPRGLARAVAERLVRDHPLPIQQVRLPFETQCGSLASESWADTLHRKVHPGVTISAFLSAPVTARAVGGLGVTASPAAAATVLAGGWLTRVMTRSSARSAGHRVATIIAIVGLAGAPLAFGSSLKHRRAWGAYGRISFAFGAAEVGMLLVGLGLLTTTFADWGAWERGFLALPMVWMMLMSGRLLRARTTEPRSSSTAENSSWASNISADETMKAAAASHSSGGS